MPVVGAATGPPRYPGATSCIGTGFPRLYGAPMATIVILDLMGGVALLLWGLHMVQSGISRAFGSDLRWVLSQGAGQPLLPRSPPASD